MLFWCGNGLSRAQLSPMLARAFAAFCLISNKNIFMSDATLTAQPDGVPKISKISEAVIRIAGNSQDGIQAIGGFLARLAGRSEQEVMTFMTIPSTISGGPSIFQVRVGSGEVLSPGDDADMLVAFYQHSYESHINSLKK